MSFVNNKIFFNLIGLSIFAILNQSCSTPHSTGKSVPQLLNGENYNTRADATKVGMIPIFANTVVNDTKIFGMMFFSHDGNKYPVRFAKIALFNDKKVIAQTNTDHNGKFNLMAKIGNGTYSLKSLSPQYNGEREVVVDGFMVDDVKFEVVKAKK